MSDLDRLGRLEGVFIDLVDVATGARELYGSAQAAEQIAGRELGEHEWRWVVTYADGARETYPDTGLLDADAVAAEAIKRGAKLYGQA